MRPSLRLGDLHGIRFLGQPIEIKRTACLSSYTAIFIGCSKVFTISSSVLAMKFLKAILESGLAQWADFFIGLHSSLCRKLSNKLKNSKRITTFIMQWMWRLLHFWKWSLNWFHRVSPLHEQQSKLDLTSKVYRGRFRFVSSKGKILCYWEVTRDWLEEAISSTSWIYNFFTHCCP